ncbi:hypothetical protein PR048_009256 [Dryococelus australis]|uniref:Uncharacterized protein n=1 Tax=Dryococelus australis TaxID=614101 RepID=A0ABQ9HZE6_9NEOP|nr:hypothetical protein PR048_009256 [Dryococelus australis]
MFRAAEISSLFTPMPPGLSYKTLSLHAFQISRLPTAFETSVVNQRLLNGSEKSYSCRVSKHRRGTVLHPGQAPAAPLEPRMAQLETLEAKSGAGMKGWEKWEIPEKTRRPTASSGTIFTCENPVTRPGIKPGSSWWEASLVCAPWSAGPEYFASGYRKRERERELSVMWCFQGVGVQTCLQSVTVHECSRHERHASGSLGFPNLIWRLHELAEEAVLETDVRPFRREDIQEGAANGYNKYGHTATYIALVMPLENCAMRARWRGRGAGYEDTSPSSLFIPNILYDIGNFVKRQSVDMDHHGLFLKGTATSNLEVCITDLLQNMIRVFSTSLVQ